MPGEMGPKQYNEDKNNDTWAAIFFIIALICLAIFAIKILNT